MTTIESASAAVAIMPRLKAETQAQHDATEHGAFNENLVKGKLPLESFVDSLEQLFLIHQALETHLRRFMDREPAFRAVLRDYQFQEPYLRDDLAHFGRNTETITPLPATRRFLEEIDELANKTPVALLGVHYVFEGSNNGSKFIARAVRRAYALAENAGARYLDPYGERQKDYWQQFKDDMNAVAFTSDQMDGIVAAARLTFERVMQLHHELHQRMNPGNPAPARHAPAADTAPAVSRCPFHAAKHG